MRQTELHLTGEARLAVDKIRSKGVHSTREVNRTRMLSCLDRGLPEAQMMAVLEIGRTAVWRTHATYLQGGVDLAVFDVTHANRPHRYDTGAEARVMAPTCSAPLAGRQLWTMVELERAARQGPGLGGVSQEIARRILKKKTGLKQKLVFVKSCG